MSLKRDFKLGIEKAMGTRKEKELASKIDGHLREFRRYRFGLTQKLPEKESIISLLNEICIHPTLTKDIKFKTYELLHFATHAGFFKSCNNYHCRNQIKCDVYCDLFRYKEALGYKYVLTEDDNIAIKEKEAKEDPLLNKQLEMIGTLEKINDKLDHFTDAMSFQFYSNKNYLFVYNRYEYDLEEIEKIKSGLNELKNELLQNNSNVQESKNNPLESERIIELKAIISRLLVYADEVKNKIQNLDRQFRNIVTNRNEIDSLYQLLISPFISKGKVLPHQEIEKIIEQKNSIYNIAYKIQSNLDYIRIAGKYSKNPDIIDAQNTVKNELEKLQKETSLKINSKEEEFKFSLFEYDSIALTSPYLYGNAIPKQKVIEFLKQKKLNLIVNLLDDVHQGETITFAKLKEWTDVLWFKQQPGYSKDIEEMVDAVVKPFFLTFAKGLEQKELYSQIHNAIEIVIEFIKTEESFVTKNFYHTKPFEIIQKNFEYLLQTKQVLDLAIQNKLLTEEQKKSLFLDIKNAEECITSFCFKCCIGVENYLVDVEYITSEDACSNQFECIGNFLECIKNMLSNFSFPSKENELKNLDSKFNTLFNLLNQMKKTAEDVIRVPNKQMNHFDYFIPANEPWYTFFCNWNIQAPPPSVENNEIKLGKTINKEEKLDDKSKATRALYSGIHEKNMEKIKLALNNGADVNYIPNAEESDNFFGDIYSPLFTAIIDGNKDVVECLLSSNPALLNQRDEEGCTPLMVAVIAAHPQIVRILLKHPEIANILNAKDLEGNTVFYYALINFVTADSRDFSQTADRSVILNELLDAGINTKLNQHNYDLLMKEQYKWKLSPYLLQKIEVGNPDKSEKSKDNKENTEKIKLALNNGADVITAIIDGNKDVVECLLSSNPALLNQRDEEDCTTLMVAVIAAHPQIVRILLKHPEIANILNAKDVDGNTVFYYALINFVTADPRDSFITANKSIILNELLDAGINTKLNRHNYDLMMKQYKCKLSPYLLQKLEMGNPDKSKKSKDNKENTASEDDNAYRKTLIL